MSEKNRLEKTTEFVKEKRLDYLYIEDPTDIFYLTGLKMSFGKLLISKDGSTVFADGRYFEEVKGKSPCEVMLYKRMEFEEDLFSKFTMIGFDSDKTPYSAFQKMSEKNAKVIPIASPLRSLRMIKDSKEITKMRMAAKITWSAFEYLASKLKVGVSEKELEGLFESFIKSEGADGHAFAPGISFGKNSAYPHHRPDGTGLQDGDLVLIDIGAKVDGYCADMTRVIFFGTPDPFLQKIDCLVKRAHGKVLTLVKPGMRIGDLDYAAREVFKEEGLEDKFTHSLGHGIGMDVHEAPFIRVDCKDKDVILEPGMVFTVEPGLYFPGIGGVRYEDMICVTTEGYENFF